VIAAVVLAAGAGSRIGGNKALLELDGIPFIERIVNVARQVRIGRIVVVVGHRADEVRRATPSGPDVLFLETPHPERGQLSSIQVALCSLTDAPGMLVWPVDHPLVAVGTVDLVVRSGAEQREKIVIPCHAGRGGHPTFFPRCMFGDLLALPADRGARALFHAHPQSIVRVAVADPGVRADIDTREDYDRWMTGSVPPASDDSTPGVERLRAR
jgi:molybdenum cofactor cytidylyltransferase